MYERTFVKSYPLDFKSLVAIELVVMTVFEAKRFDNVLKSGESGLLDFTPFVGFFTYTVFDE